MASKKKLTLTIERKCPKCGKVTTWSLLNSKAIRLAEILGKEIPAKIYRCDTCGNQITK